MTSAKYISQQTRKYIPCEIQSVVLVVFFVVWVVMVVVVRVSAWDAEIINEVPAIEVRNGLASDTLSEVEIVVVVAAIVGILGLVVPVVFSIVVLFEVVGVANTMSRIDVDVSTDANTSFFAVVMTASKFVVPTPLRELFC